MPNKIRLLQITLGLGSAYYLIGCIVHFFGLTLFPFYDGRLYAPYHDSLIALCSLIFAILLAAIARDPAKNKDVLKVIIISAFLASVFSIAIIWKIDFTALGAPEKHLQTIVEGIVGFVFTGAVLWLYPRNEA